MRWHSWKLVRSFHAKAHGFIDTGIFFFNYFLLMCVCVCVSVCVRERELCVCVCARARVRVRVRVCVHAVYVGYVKYESSMSKVWGKIWVKYE